ncbi:MAG: arsenate reductase ArsC [Gemmatimonadales bacterium]
MIAQPSTVLFACVHNAGRSQMAAAIFTMLADYARARAMSAGTRPLDRVHPEVVDVMAEIGIDLSAAKPRVLTEGLAREARLLVTMGCGEECPYVPGLTVVDWAIPDPKGRPADDVRVIRETIQAFVVELLRAHGWERDR